MSTLVACPTCGTNLQVPTPFTPGKPMRCPSCQSNFMLTVGVADVAPTIVPPASPRRPRRYDEFTPVSAAPENGTGKTLAYILLGGGIVVLVLLLVVGGIIGILSMAADKPSKPAQAERKSNQPAAEGPAWAKPSGDGVSAADVGGSAAAPQGLGTARPPGEVDPAQEEKKPPAEEEEETPAKPARPAAPSSASGSNPANDPAVKQLGPKQRQVILRFSKMPPDSPAQLARQALGSLDWVDKETVELDRASREIRFGTSGLGLRPEQAQRVLDKAGFKITGATIITPKGR